MSNPETGKMPVIYMSHGAPPLADDPLWPSQLAAWGAELTTPAAILMVSAHWEDAPVTFGATTTVPLYYDFGGFPAKYYQVQYPAPGAPELGERVRRLLDRPTARVHQDPNRGLDHGAYVPLKEMYPNADIPVLQMSMPTLDPQRLYDIGKAIAPLRDEGVLIVGSGFFTHNLRGLTMSQDPDAAPSWSREFDHWGRDILAAHDIDALLNFQQTAPAARLAHPRTEHLAPLFVTLGAGEADIDTQRTVIEGFWGGLAKRSIQIG